jgi:1,4-dihydroxy-2-naphthoate octaprenyltransferase
MEKHIITPVVFLTLTIILSIYYFYKTYKSYKEYDEDKPVEHLIKKIYTANLMTALALAWAAVWQYINIDMMLKIIEKI